MDCNINFPYTDKIPTTLFALDIFNLTLYLSNIKKTLEKLDRMVPLSPSCPKFSTDSVKITGIIDCDLISYFKVCEIVPHDGDKLVQLSNGFLPFGDLEALLSSDSAYSCRKIETKVSFVNEYPHYPQKISVEQSVVRNNDEV